MVHIDGLETEWWKIAIGWELRSSPIVVLSWNPIYWVKDPKINTIISTQTLIEKGNGNGPEEEELAGSVNLWKVPFCLKAKTEPQPSENNSAMVK
jgi:hypothetical protein